MSHTISSKYNPTLTGNGQPETGGAPCYPNRIIFPWDSKEYQKDYNECRAYYNEGHVDRFELNLMLHIIAAKYQTSRLDQVKFDQDPQGYRKAHLYFRLHYLNKLNTAQNETDIPCINQVKAEFWELPPWYF